jgi:hypothetical protein
MHRVARIVTTVAIASLAFPAASEAVVTFGSSLSPTANFTLACLQPCTAGTGNIPAASTASGGALAPIDGVVVRWRVKSAGTVSATALRITRPGSSTTRVGVGRGDLELPTANATSTFLTRLPIKAGDAIAVDSAGTSTFYTNTAPAASLIVWFAPTLTEGGPPRAANSTTPGALPLINADIEADADHDGFGDETQDLCPQEASLQAACPFRLDVNETGPGRITGDGIDCPGDCGSFYAAGQPVTLTATETTKGFLFAGFRGDCASAAGVKTCTTTMDANKVVSAPFNDHEPPQTTLTKQPKKVSGKPKVKFAFKSDEKGSRFQCTLDKKDFSAKFCASPATLKVKPGSHVLRVRAVDPSDNVDPTPAKAKFKIKG